MTVYVIRAYKNAICKLNVRLNNLHFIHVNCDWELHSNKRYTKHSKTCTANLAYFY